MDSENELLSGSSTPKKKRARRNELTKEEKKEYKSNYLDENG